MRRCPASSPVIVDQSSVLGLSVETTGPLLNTSQYQCFCDDCTGRRPRHHRDRRHRR